MLLTKDTLSESFAKVLDWHQKKHPEIRDIRLGYDLWGFALIGIYWHDKKGRLHDQYCAHSYPGILNIFESALKKHPPTKIISHI